MGVGWLSVIIFPLLVSFFGCGMMAALERDRRFATFSVFSLLGTAALVAAYSVTFPV